MENLTCFLFIAGVILFSLIYLFTGKLFVNFFKLKNDAVTYESAKEALTRIANWTTWLTGIQTAAIATMGLIIKSPASSQLKTFGFFTILFFGTSVILATWLLSSLPSIQQRLINSKKPEEQNDIYMMPLFSFVSFRLGRFSGLIHTYFLIGIIFYALFIFKKFGEQP